MKVTTSSANIDILCINLDQSQLGRLLKNLANDLCLHDEKHGVDGIPLPQTMVIKYSPPCPTLSSRTLVFIIDKRPHIYEARSVQSIAWPTPPKGRPNLWCQFVFCNVEVEHHHCPPGTMELLYLHLYQHEVVMQATNSFETTLVPLPQSLGVPRPN